ncbi:MAG: hypothetical protein U1E76_19460 [Planctomycetota bacterium]
MAPAHAGEFRPVSYRTFRIWPPIVLAPMAGVTNPPFRTSAAATALVCT